MNLVGSQANKTVNLAAAPLRFAAAGYGQRWRTEKEGDRPNMPVISTFFGIVIRMFYLEHGLPHFHAEYQGQQATFTFDGEILAGGVQSGTARRLIKEWSLAHRAELDANWGRIATGEPLERIAPLD